jgi:hypothetical protein
LEAEHGSTDLSDDKPRFGAQDEGEDEDLELAGRSEGLAVQGELQVGGWAGFGGQGADEWEAADGDSAEGASSVLAASALRERVWNSG